MEQVATAPVPPRAQVVNVPVPELVRPMVPLGVMAVPDDVSATVTVQLVELLTTIVVGWQDIVVVVVRSVTVIVVVPWLVVWLASAGNVALMVGVVVEAV